MRKVIEVFRGVFFLVGLALSFIPALFIMCVVTLGSWFEDGLRLVGVLPRKEWLPLLAGFIGYVGLGIAAPAYLGSLLIGWPGTILAPLLMLAVVAVLGKW